MRLSQLTLTDFRSYAQAELELQPGPNVLLGFNGVGKTNIAEAIGYLSTLSSHRVSQDGPLVRHGQKQAFIRAEAHRGSRQARLEVEINPGRSNRARINRGNPVRATDVLGILRTVLFAPEDLDLIKGSPTVRRRLLDDLAVQLRPALGRVRLDYEKVLKQRNALLKSLRHESFTATHESTLAVWDHQLAEAGSHLLKARLEMLTALRPHAATAYEQLSGSIRTARLRYLSSLEVEAGPGQSIPARNIETQNLEAQNSENESESSSEPEPVHAAVNASVDASALESASRQELAELMLQGLASARREEGQRAITLVGPHRDDIAFTLDEVPVKGFASHGETWSFALALRLAAYRVMLDDDPSEGAQPVLILDDVFAELDARRRRRLAELAAEAEQLIVTAAVDDDVPASLMRHALRVESVDQISQVTPHERD
ncbi:DNA replication/repair protein RecF [Nesterenkonia sp. E16_7]|uniref:DNA replication/repair protein RecF n=1 Tax=unclassified Nesterenkonia TaxID=2629769 RepID=UPI001A915A39|nr:MULTISPECIES: DNA replication/repair protein RecF [unclassified Nesterenkonia]MBO0594652.1 DNA replication/repair protein RecF [Nesterenkonia sp. E16_10]MBO0598009.1 DNA replication/repair protein RecF [Nesterenkonia sp. E16_7]